MQISTTRFGTLAVDVDDLLHFPHGLPEQCVGFLKSVEDGMEIGLEQSGYSSDQCHGFYLLKVGSLDGEFSLGRTSGHL